MNPRLSFKQNTQVITTCVLKFVNSYKCYAILAYWTSPRQDGTR